MFLPDAEAKYLLLLTQLPPNRDSLLLSVYGGDKCRMQNLQPHNDCMHAADLAAEKERGI